MFAQLVSFVTLASLLIPARAVPGPAWIRRQSDAQSSLTLDPAVISHGLEQDGQGDNPDPGQVRSLTSSNNFINFCLPFLNQGVPLTDGKQIATGSCNQVPMGRIVSLDLAPRSKFVFPPNGDDSIIENTAFTIKMKLLFLQAGNFVNAQANYYGAPAQVNDQGILIGHTHFVIEPLPDLQTTEPLDPLAFAFFKGINDPVDGNNILQTTVTAGLKAGVYRLCSINTASNHQPALVSNAQHGSLDDCSYFTVKSAGSVADVSTTASATETNIASTTASVSDSASVSVTDSASTTVATESATATDSTSDAATTSDATDSATSTEDASSTDAATSDSTTDAPAATESAPAPDSTSDAASSDDQASSTAAPDAVSSTDAAPPAETTSAADNGNGNGDNNGGNNDNGNNGGNNGNADQGTPSSDAASSPAPSDNGNADPAPSNNGNADPAPSDNAPSDPAPSDNGNNDPAPSDNGNGNADPAPTPDAATPTPDAGSQGNDNGSASTA